MIPRKCGRITKEAAINTSVRQKEIAADTFPLERAVKKPEEAMFIPLNRKLIANSGNPASARAKVSGSWVKILTNEPAAVTAAMVRITEEAAVNTKAI